MGFYDVYHGVNEMVKKLCIELVRMSDEHMAEVREDNGGVDSMTDEELLEYGLVRLPKDADGVRWTGEEREFADSDGRRGGCVGLLWLGDEWAVMDSLPHDFVTDAPGMCRHVPDADTPASLADGLAAKEEG